MRKTVQKEDLSEKQLAALNLRKMFMVKKQQNLGEPNMEHEIGEVFSRQAPDETDPFTGIYDSLKLIEPPFDFMRLQRIYEESDVLQSCIEAMIKNVDGFGYKLAFLGDDVTEADKTENQVEYKFLRNFFDHINDEQSFMMVRKLMRMDYEMLGNGGLEVIRNMRGQIQILNYLPFRYVRCSNRDRKGTVVERQLPRDGKLVPIRVRKYFRKFAQYSPIGRRYSWFKEFGDPRFLDATDGLYKPTSQECKVLASEFIHFKSAIGASAYGIPRWIGALLDVVGRRSSQFVNYDMFENQGIPPLVVLVSGGKLTDESIAELEGIVRGMRGVEQWNRIALLESEFEASGLDEKGTAKIELKSLSEHRKEDLMFNSYLDQTNHTIRHRFRLPPLYVGSAETFTHATARASKLAAEEQVFVPERMDFDEFVNNRIVRQELQKYNWRYHSLGPKIVGADELSSGVGSFVAAGALTINHAIELANEAFGTDMSKFNEDWANYPVAIVLELVKLAQLKGIEEIAIPVPKPSAPGAGGFPQKPAVAAPAAAGVKQLPAPVKKMIREKILKSDLFSDEEKVLYKRLLTIQGVIEGKIDQLSLGLMDDHGEASEL